MNPHKHSIMSGMTAIKAIKTVIKTIVLSVFYQWNCLLYKIYI